MIATLDRTAKIRELNDLARKAMGVCSTVVQTEGIRALPSGVQSAIREAVEKFGFDPRTDDPYQERDFGTIRHGDVNGDVKAFWKIDYYDKALEYGSAEPWDASKTTRVLTIMLAEEY